MQTDEHPATAESEAPASKLSLCGRTELAPPDVTDPVLEVYKKDVDRSLLRRNLGLTPAERAEKLVDFLHFLEEVRRAGQKLHVQKK